MPPRDPAPAAGRLARRAVVCLAAVMVAVVPAPLDVGAAVPQQATAGPAISVAPTCVAAGVASRVVILGASWAPGAVSLERNADGVVTQLGTATARTSPVRQRPGSFSFTATITATTSFRVVGRQDGEPRAAADVVVQSTCPLQIAVKPPCLSAAGPVQVSGSGFTPGSQIPIDVDPFGNAETPSSQTVAVGQDGTFSTTVEVPFTGATVPIIATRPSTAVIAVVPAARAVAFVDPCPPPVTTTSTTRPPPGVGVTTTTAGNVAQPTTTSTTRPSVPPDIPPVDVPTPGATAEVSYSPRTVRPGRCVVVVVTSAPAGLAVVARFADGPAVTTQTSPAGGAVLSLCHPHDSGIPLGPVKVLLGIGPAAPIPVFTVLRVPARPQPPLLQSGADGRRS